MEDDLREESGVEGYIECIKNNGVSLSLNDKARIIRDSISNTNYNYNYKLESELSKYIDINEEDGFIKFYDREFNLDSQMEAANIIKKDFLESHLPDLRSSKHEWAFDTDGSIYKALTDEQALEIANDFPLSVFLMDESNYQVLVNDNGLARVLIIGYDLSLDFASVDLKSDKKFVLEAVRQDGYSLRYANNELKADKEVVLEAVKQNGNALYFASDEIKKLVGSSDPVEILTRAINAETLHAKLNSSCLPRSEANRPKMKI